MKQSKVIFLINSKDFKNETIRVKLEELTHCKVYDFINFEEASLYSSLKPDVIIYSSNHTKDVDQFRSKGRCKLIDIASKANQKGKNHIRKHSNLLGLLDTF